MRVFILLASVCVASAGVLACGDEADDSSGSGTPVSDAAQPSPDAGSTDVSVTQGDAQSSPLDVEADGVSAADSTADSAAVDSAAAEDVVVLSLETGPDDSFSQTGCALMDGPKTSPVAGATVREAGQQILLPSHDSGYVVSLPESGIGFVTLEVPDWQVVIALYTTAAVELVVHDPEGKTEVVQALSWAAPCADQQITEQRTKFHKWGGFTLELRGEPGGEAWLAAIDLPVE